MAENLALLSWYWIAVLGMNKEIRFFCQDETRIGLKTISVRRITARGVKPKGKVQWQFKAIRYADSTLLSQRRCAPAHIFTALLNLRLENTFSTSLAILIVIAFKSFSI